ncbi:MAG TPA: Co2+/Mg2+ efflux protein ApaG [Gammaproteobacteria bacterium]|nr:Co2+/Mg2+ efflux protein ApaG [Gammaproteobacteria bacterium]
MDLQAHKIDISVITKYLPEQSAPAEFRFAFSYTITIFNAGNIAALLMRRHWEITNANGEVREVDGKGVVGEQPHLQPGESFRYTSGAIIDTPVGSMQGTYTMLADDGTEFLAHIPAFRLAMPEIVH